MVNSGSSANLALIGAVKKYMNWQDGDEIVVRLSDGSEFKGTEVKRDPRTDVAILKIDAGKKLPALKFGDSDQTEVGDWVIAIGNPLGQELTVTSGIISARATGSRSRAGS